MHMHASCVAREGAGVLLLGPSGSGKSDLALRLIDRGFMLVADDGVEIEDGRARPSPPLAGLLEIRGLGIVCLPHLPDTALALAVDLTAGGDRLPAPERHATLDLPLIRLDSRHASAAAVVAYALDCATGTRRLHTGAFARDLSQDRA
jgi:HPr kinase/phosphorylase